MIDRAQVPLVTHNLHGGPDKNRKRRRRTINLFLNTAQCGIGGFNELNRHDRRYLRRQAAKRGLKTFIYKSNGAVWTPTIVQVDKKRVKRVMTGGHVGADGIATPQKGDDDRRVGPNRYAIYLTCKLLALDLDFEFVVTHLMARSFTKHRWRIPLFRKSLRSLAKGTRDSNGVLVGDVNSKDYIDLPDMLDAPEKTPPTFGRKKYDQFIRWGPHIDIVNIRALETLSDHDMLVGTIEFYKHPIRRRR